MGINEEIYMFLKISRLFTVCVLIVLTTNSVFAKTAQEECDAASGVDDITCKVCEPDCAVITLRTGEKIIKRCGEYQCDMVPSASDCANPDCVNQ